MAWHTVQEVNRTIHVGRLKITIDWRSPKSFMGRFGGGWQWKLGIQGAGRVWILSLLVFSVRFRLDHKEAV